MKSLGRLLGFFIFVLLVGTSLYFHYGTPPFSAIPSKSMVPTFQIGDLVIIEEVTPSDVKVGDIIVVDVPEAVMERFGYPPNIIHRVVKVDRTGGKLQFRVKGDNNGGEDPFTVLPKYIMGTPAASYPYLGYPILFLSSRQGFYFFISALALYLLYVIFEELSKRQISFRRGISSFFFADVFSRTKQIEEGQEKVLEILSERYSSAESALVEETDEVRTLPDIIKQIEKDRLFISKMEEESKGDPRYQAILETLVDLEDQIEDVMKARSLESRDKVKPKIGENPEELEESTNSEDMDGLDAEEVKVESHHNVREFPPRRSKKKARGLFRKR
ncbi:MAG TPA: signal peptidase I [Bacillales bacterium]|nr:signal peptidase I [Bacillales bacterium]